VKALAVVAFLAVGLAYLIHWADPQFRQDEVGDVVTVLVR
jgi:hypothetical protein